MDWVHNALTLGLLHARLLTAHAIECNRLDTGCQPFVVWTL